MSERKGGGAGGALLNSSLVYAHALQICIQIHFQIQIFEALNLCVLRFPPPT